jgi:hypothetical protein
LNDITGSEYLLCDHHIKLGEALIISRLTPWTTYAVFQTTLTAWAFTDLLMFFLFYRATEDLPADIKQKILTSVGIWIFVFAKSIKLYGHWIRYPADLLMLPYSILFGHLHGIIKLVGLLTLSAVRYNVLQLDARQSLTV